MSFPRRYSRKRLIAGGAILTLGIGMIAGPMILDGMVRTSVRAALELKGFQVVGGEVELTPLRGVGTARSLRLVRERPHEHLEAVIDRAIVHYGLGEVLAEPSRLSLVEVSGLRVDVRRTDRPAKLDPKPRSLLLERVVATDVVVSFEDRGPETLPGEPFLLSVEVDEGLAEKVWLDDVVRTSLLRTTLRGRAAGGTLALSQGRLHLGGGELAPFSTFLTHVAPLRIEGGKCAVWATMTERPDGGLDVWTYLEVWGLSVAATKGRHPDLLRDVSLAALVAYLESRGAFFAHAFRAEIPGAALSGLPAHDARVLGETIAEALVRSLLDDRLDPRRPEPRPLHPELSSPKALAARLGAREPGQRREVFDGALNGRVLEAVTVTPQAVGKSFLGLGKPWLRGELDGLQIKVRALAAPAKEGQARTFGRLVAVGIEESEGASVLVLEPASD